MDEAHGVSCPDIRIAQSLGQEALAHTGRSHQQDVLVLVQELQGESGVHQSAVQNDGCRPVKILHAAGSHNQVTTALTLLPGTGTIPVRPQSWVKKTPSQPYLH